MKNVIGALALAIASFSTSAAQVECLISGTPTEQFFEPHSCSSQASGQNAEIVFRVNASKPIKSVTWSHHSDQKGRWDCGSHNRCRFSGRSGSASAEACASKVVYTDGTQEFLSSCAHGLYWVDSPVILNH